MFFLVQILLFLALRGDVKEFLFRGRASAGGANCRDCLWRGGGVFSAINQHPQSLLSQSVLCRYTVIPYQCMIT